MNANVNIGVPKFVDNFIEFIDRAVLERVAKAVYAFDRFCGVKEEPRFRTSGDYAKFYTRNAEALRSTETDSRIVLQ